MTKPLYFDMLSIRASNYVGVKLPGCCSFYCLAFFTDPCTLTAAATLVEQFRTADMTGFVQNDRFNIGREKREDPFHTHAIRDLTDSKAGGCAAALLLDHIAFERLDPFLVTFNDLIVHGNIITSFELGKLPFCCKLLVYKGNCVHNLKFKDGKGRDLPVIKQIYSC